RIIAEGGRIPQLGDFIPLFMHTPVNLMLLVGIVLLVLCYILIWHTRFGYAMRTLGFSPTASVYAGMSNSRIIMIVMALSGALAAMVAVNEVLGVPTRLSLDFVADAGFVGIAVALMGRNHPIGVGLAALLFGALYQGGNELQYVVPGLTRELVVVIQALVILFTGAMEGLLRPPLQRVMMLLPERRPPQAVAARSEEHTSELQSR